MNRQKSGNDEDAERHEPVAGDGSDSQADDDAGDVTAADEDQMHETVVRRLVRGKVVARGGRVFGLPMVGHRVLQSLAPDADIAMQDLGGGLAQMPREDNGGASV